MRAPFGEEAATAREVLALLGKDPHVSYAGAALAPADGRWGGDRERSSQGIFQL